MTQIHFLKHIICTVSVAVVTATGPVSAGETKLDEAALANWRQALVEARDMAPKWAVQGADAFKTSSDAGVPVFYLDVRTPEEWDMGVVEGAVLVSLTDLPTLSGLSGLPADTSTIIAVYCKSGHRSALAVPLLHQLGYVNAISMMGGYEGWVEAGYPITGAAE